MREDAIDAFAHFEHMNRGSVEPPVVVAPSYACPFCRHAADSPGALQDHVSEAHHISRPALLVQGAEPPRNSEVRTGRDTLDFAVVNATSMSISVNGAGRRQVRLPDLAATLATTPWGKVEVVLENAAIAQAAPVTTSYEITFRIARSSVLTSVDDAFASMVATRSLSVDAVRRFTADPRCAGEGGDYAHGLAEYVIGVLLKERPQGSNLTLPLEEYRTRFGSALHKLGAHRRPLPTLVSSIIRFALNDVHRSAVTTGFDDLDLATTMITEAGAIAAPSSVTGGVRRRHMCPVDQGTGRILDLATRLAGECRWGPVLREECRSVSSAGSLDIMDRRKALALWASTAWRLGATEEAVEPLTQISAVYPFSTWAQRCLETVTA